MSTLAKVDSVDSRSDCDTLTLHDNQSVASKMKIVKSRQEKTKLRGKATQF